MFEEDSDENLKIGLTYLVSDFIWDDFVKIKIKSKEARDRIISLAKSFPYRGSIEGFMFRNENYPDVAPKVKELFNNFYLEDYCILVDEVVIKEGY